jgi:DnaJ-class molecular chaperone
MYDLAHQNDAPGRCGKCRGTGVYSWGASVNGKMERSGRCNSCRGTGRQTVRDIMRNATYNRYKIARICEGA